MTHIAILTDTLQQGECHATAFGDSASIATLSVGSRRVLVCAPETADPRATVRALRDLGVTHVWLCESVGALSPLLDVGDWLVPDDYIDGTRGQHYTYFSEKAGGYAQQTPPFDPASRDALTVGAGSVSARTFRRGVYVCVSNTRLETPAEAAFWTRAGGHVVGRFLSPCLTLARELGMEVAVLAQVVRSGGEPGSALPLATYEPALVTAFNSLASD